MKKSNKEIKKSNKKEKSVLDNIEEGFVPTPTEDNNESTPLTHVLETEEEKASINDNSGVKPKKVKLKYRTKENDIKYLGPLSYRYIRIIAWLFLAIAQISIILRFALRINPSIQNDFTVANELLSFIASMPLVLFLLANFGVILRNRHNFKYLFIFYGGIMVALYAVANIVVLHYVYGLFHTINSEISLHDVCLLSGAFLGSIGTSGYIFNLFVDLFLCVLTVFFFFYVPKSKVFEGKKIIIFRLFTIIPLAYEIVSLVLKHYAMLEMIVIPSYFFFLLTSKPPLTFLAFFLITLIMKIREVHFLKRYDGNEDLLKEHYSTNAHSLRTSITIAVVFAIVSFIDLIATVIYIIFQAIRIGPADESFGVALYMASNIGLGSSTSLILIIPFVLLYSYTRVHKDKKLDSFIPFLGIALMVFTLIEGIYLTVRFTIPYWSDSLSMFLGGGEEMGETDLEGLEAIKTLGRIFIK